MHKVVLVVAAMAALIPSAPSLSAPCAGFADVDDASAFCSSVAWMKNRGITFGLTPTQYDPGSPVTRLQMAAFMYRLGYQNAFLQGGNAFGATAVLGTTDLQAVDIRVSGLSGMRFDVSRNVIGGSGENNATGGYGVIAGGGATGATCNPPSRPSRACANVVGGNASIGGGASNIATGSLSTIAGGYGNAASGTSATVAGGIGNLASGIDSTVAGGIANNALGRRSFAAGSWANAANEGCFVWADATNSNLTSCFANNEFVARSSGGFYFWTSGSDDNSYSGARLAPGTGAWAVYSDRNGKEVIELANTDVVLEKLISMPIATWQWKAEPGAIRHMGPMAQDFHRAFGLGDSDTQIVTIDADGVALAAIQGLNSKLESKLAAKDSELAALKEQVADIRAKHQKELADLRLAVELLMARTSAEGRVVQFR